MALNDEQNLAFQHIIDGHNVLIIGPAGIGKSHLIKKTTVDTLKQSGKKVYITATTGIASSHYADATTIHRWSGIGDGRHSVEDLKDIISNNKQYLDVKNRIHETDVLIIDECSMMRQLPPVPNTLCGDDGDYCFSSKIFNKMFPHQIELKEVIRQKETDLIKAIEECSMGNASPHTVTFIRSLNRPLPEKVSIVTPMLFSTNELVDDFNRKSIIEQPGQMYEFIATDTGEKRYLDKMTVSKVLWLNIGVPVILMHNLTDKLVNGLQGYVTGITEDGPVVKFAGNEVPIKKSKMYSPLKNMDVAVREQYPIKLAFAISIHKSQGMTLDRPISKRTVTNASMSRIRYIGGYCIAKVHYKYLQEKSQICIKLIPKIRCLILNADKHLKKRSLTYISNSLFDFFKAVTELCLKMLSDEYLNKYGENHLMVMLNQYRKYILESFNVEKKMSHRKQIQVSKPAGKGKGKISKK
ncbi:PIF1-like protein, partial [Mya arenaria]